MDAETLFDLKTILESMVYSGWTDEPKTVRKAIEFIEQQTRPLSLEECRDILNANKHRLCLRNNVWVVDGDRLCDGWDTLTLFEATALARAYLAQGGAK